MTLLVSSSAFGQFQVQPMKVVVPVSAGRRTPIEVTVENTTPNMTHDVYLSLAGITQDANGIWQAIEPGTPIENRSDGTKWATVRVSDMEQLHLEISKIRSCESWLRMDVNQVSIRPLNRKPVRLIATVPTGTSGYYCAALLARAFVGRQEIQGRTANVVLEFVVPIILQIQGRPEREGVELTDVGLEFHPQDADSPAATLVSLGIVNNGGTYSLLRGYARIWNKFGGHWRKITDVEFPKDISIIPGVQFHLRQDTVVPLGAGEYKVEGYVFVDGKKGPALSKEFMFGGDPRVRSTRPGAPLDLEKRDLTIVARPSMTRAENLLVANPLDETITVTVEASLPEHMKDAFVGNVRGDQFDCTDWLQVTPTQLTLQAYQRANVRIQVSMPADAKGANYYAAIRFHARHTDGTQAGITDSRVCIQNDQGQGTISIHAHPLKFGRLSPGRYAVTARFLNYGDTEIQPTCQALLTAGLTSQVARRFSLSCDILNGSGVLLPLENRNFTGVLDVAGLNAGDYRLTVFLTHDRGGRQPDPTQVAVRIADGPDGKTLDTLDISDAGGPITIRLQ